MNTGKSKNPISVLHPITRLIVGGAQENTIYTAALLDKARYKVEILSGPQTGSEGSLIEEVRRLEIPLIIQNNLVREVNPFKDIFTYQDLFNAMRINKYDIVHTHSSKAGILGRWAAKRAGVPIIIHTIHGWGFHDYMPTILKYLYIYLERLTASFTDTLVAVSNFDIRIGLEEGIGKKQQYELIRSAIPTAEFKSDHNIRNEIRRNFGISDEMNIIGNVGRFSQQKNPFDWLKIASEIHKSKKKVHFVLVGDGPLYMEVESRIESMGLSNNFTITGLRRDVTDLLSIMDIFMITSLWEGLPRTVLQAMVKGIPIISYKVGGIPEIVREGITGYLCDPKDILTMAKRCSLLLNNPLHREEMGKKGQSFVTEEFDLPNMIDQISNLYEKLILKKIKKSGEIVVGSH
jgi:glycosyltransferase involved in cell wall biosynthesis